MGLRLAILKDVGKGESEVVLEYDEKMVLSRLQARVREGLSEKENFIKHSWSKAEVAKILNKSFNDLVVEFKEETVRLK